MYVAAKGGAEAIDNAHAWLAEERRGDRGVAELSVAQIREQLSLAVARVMSEGSLYDPDLAALALKQARGDSVEAIFLVRAYRATLPRFGYSQPLDTARMCLKRRVSATYKDLPGGQLLGPTFDYTHRLIDFALAADGDGDSNSNNNSNNNCDGEAKAADAAGTSAERGATALPPAVDILDQEGLIEREPGDDERDVPDLTREPLRVPAERAARLQNLARGDEGFLLALGYSSQRGFGNSHPFAGEIRYGTAALTYRPPELGFEIEIGDVELTECQMVNQFLGGAHGSAPRFTRGYGLCFGHGERRAMAMALLDRGLRAEELGELNDGSPPAPAQDQEFVLAHSDSLEASGFVQHLKLPHYVDFQAELEQIRRLRAAAEKRSDDEPECKVGQ